MYYYKIIKITGSELSEINKNIWNIHENLKHEFVSKHKTKVKNLHLNLLKFSKSSEGNELVENELNVPLRNGILKIYPTFSKEILTTLGMEKFSLENDQYLEIRINELAEAGWELDKLRLDQNHTKGLIIMRKSK